MDFMVGLLRTLEGYNAIWVIVDRLTKSARFIPIKVTYSMKRLAEIYITNVVRLHGVLLSIISDRDARFFVILEMRAKGTRDTTKVQHCFSPSNGWSIKKDHPDARRHVEKLCICWKNYRLRLKKT